MAVREFDGTDDNISHDVGGLSGWTFGTTACIFKSASVTGGSKWIAGLHTSGGTFRSAPLGLSTTDRLVAHDGTDVSLSPTSFIAAGTWYLVVLRKVTGTATPRYSLYNFTSTTWTHAAGAATLVNSTAPGAGGTVRTSVEGTEFFIGRLAVRGMWTLEAHWSPDASGDTAIEAAGLEDSLQNWIDETPTALWAFNQADVGTACDDLVGTSDQSSLTGTTVVTGDDPPGFSFDLGPGPPVPDLFVVRSGVTLA
jgi:hypothetical protein